MALTPEELELAKIKKDIFTAVITSGSLKQKEESLKVSEEAYQWCIGHAGQAKAPVAPIKK